MSLPKKINSQNRASHHDVMRNLSLQYPLHHHNATPHHAFERQASLQAPFKKIETQQLNSLFIKLLLRLTNEHFKKNRKMSH